MKVEIRLLNEFAVKPKKYSESAVGYDVSAAIESALTIEPGKVLLVPTGFSMAIEPGYEAQIRPRSGLALKHQVGMLNSPGTIDPDYRGEVKVIMFNFGTTPFVIEPGMRIAQMVIAKYENVKFEIVDQLDDTLRGEGGFGHTKI
ncbi:MAG: deoxyuridine 5'-triphosphate nucleotidohydrolase [Candidatus Cloacimonetes bacterium 4572_65]|nr:MAG: deoxyuridine 5'-triphosphate nucleotidohydrolase [Candidatus Cloacimonetes bacterium 4572_65]